MAYWPRLFDNKKPCQRQGLLRRTHSGVFPCFDPERGVKHSSRHELRQNCLVGVIAVVAHPTVLDASFMGGMESLRGGWAPYRNNWMGTLVPLVPGPLSTSEANGLDALKPSLSIDSTIRCGRNTRGSGFFLDRPDAQVASPVPV